MPFHPLQRADNTQNRYIEVHRKSDLMRFRNCRHNANLALMSTTHTARRLETIKIVLHQSRTHECSYRWKKKTFPKLWHIPPPPFSMRYFLSFFLFKEHFFIAFLWMFCVSRGNDVTALMQGAKKKSFFRFLSPPSTLLNVLVSGRVGLKESFLCIT